VGSPSVQASQTVDKGAKRADLRLIAAVFAIAAVMPIGVVAVLSRFACSTAQLVGALPGGFGALLVLSFSLSVGGALLAGWGIRARRHLAWQVLIVAASLVVTDGLYACVFAHDLFRRLTPRTFLLSLPLTTPVHLIVLAVAVSYFRAVRRMEAAQPSICAVSAAPTDGMSNP